MITNDEVVKRLINSEPFVNAKAKAKNRVINELNEKFIISSSELKDTVYSALGDFSRNFLEIITELILKELDEKIIFLNDNYISVNNFKKIYGFFTFFNDKLSNEEKSIILSKIMKDNL